MIEHENITNSLAHTKWNCKGYYVDTAGKNTKAIKEYIANQLEQDKKSEQLSMFDPHDPFTGSK